MQSARDLLDPAEVRLDVVRVVARRRHHHAHAARARIERDDRAAAGCRARRGPPAGRSRRASSRRCRRRSACRSACRGTGRRATRGCGPSRSGSGSATARARCATARRSSSRRRARRAGPAGSGGSRTCGRPTRRSLLRARTRDGREDQAALDLELGDALDRVVLALGERRAGPGLPVRRRDDQGDEEAHREAGDPGDLPVHRCTAVAAARFETRSSKPSMTKLDTIDEPP